MENLEGPYEQVMHMEYLELISLDNPNWKPQSQWTEKDWSVYEHEAEKKQ